MKLKKTLAILLTLCMLLSFSGLAAHAEDARPVTVETVSYIDKNGETQTVEAGVIEDGGQPYGAQGETNWYVVKGVSSVSDQVSFYDAEVNLILADGAELTFDGRYRNLVCFNGSLNIYAQEAGTGKLTLTGNNRITSMYGDVQVFGGEITTEAITPDYMNNKGTLSIYGGTVNSKLLFGKNVNICGGTVEGQISNISGTFRMTGGSLNAHTYSDIGSSIPIHAGSIEISGGTVIAEGQYGMYSPSGSITVTGGEVTATANAVNSGMGISAYAITITGGKVSATSERSFGIFSTGTVTFGADVPGTEITFNKPYPQATYVIKDGQTMTDGENDYTGTLTAEQVAALSGVTLTLTCKHDWTVEWTWTGDFTATAHFTCSVCGEEKTLEADVTCDAGVYTATVELDGTPYTSKKAKTVTLTFDMGGKCENYIVEAEAGADMVNHYMAAMNSAQAEGFVMTGFAPLPPENYETINAFNAASSALFTCKVPETDTVYYGFWKTLITPEIAVGELRCGASLPDTLPQITPSEPDKVAVYEQHWFDAEGTAVGGQAYAMYVSLEAGYSWAFTADAPVVSGADTVGFRALRVLDTLELNVTAQHYTDGTSRRTETVITPATATTAGEKQICIYCAGGCGEIVDTYTEPIPATGAPDGPDEPADTDNVCPWCGEIHDKSTFVGFWTEFIHDLLYIIRQLFSWCF